MLHNSTIDLLVKILSGSANAEEKQLVDTWLNESEE
jgi:predicted outer membrane protein